MPAEVCAWKSRPSSSLPGGSPPGRTPARRCRPARAVIAADGGVDRALALGLHVDVGIGDFDRSRPAGLAAADAGRSARSSATRPPRTRPISSWRSRRRLRSSPSRIVVVGGGRRPARPPAWCRSLLLADERYAGAEVDAYLGESRVHLVRGSRRAGGAPGDSSRCCRSRDPPKGSAEGLEYPLRRETLSAGTSRGMSNAFVGAEARVTVERGCLLTVQPASSGGSLVTLAQAFRWRWGSSAGGRVRRCRCGGSGEGGESQEVVLVTHDSFTMPKAVKAAFERESGLKLRSSREATPARRVNRALLTKGNPQGDVLFGDRHAAKDESVAGPPWLDEDALGFDGDAVLVGDMADDVGLDALAAVDMGFGV